MSKDAVCRKEDLTNLRPEHATFVGIDSDGCVFDTMEAKQKLCFHPLIVAHWRLEPVEKQLRETAEFVNLYSRHRGTNRFAALLLTFDLLRRRPEVPASGVALPGFPSLRRFCDSGLPLSNASLERVARETGDAELAAVLAWSEAVNRAIARTVTDAPPFPGARESLAAIAAQSDAICISQTPAEALAREWRRHGLTEYVRIIAGQELGAKTEHLRLAAAGRYPPGNVLVIGDAPGDLRAARDNQALFYPINPGDEAGSWERFRREAYGRFLGRDYAGAYEEALVSAFEKLLPETPNW